MHWGNRDERGRFLKYKTPAAIKDDSINVNKAVYEAYKDGFIAGLNAQSGILLPSRKLQIFLSQKGYN
jgi:hypothetical protein